MKLFNEDIKELYVEWATSGDGVSKGNLRRTEHKQEFPMDRITNIEISFKRDFKYSECITIYYEDRRFVMSFTEIDINVNTGRLGWCSKIVETKHHKEVK